MSNIKQILTELDFPKEKFGTKSEEYQLLSSLDPERLPAHIAVIMDGNGRWAKKRAMPRQLGHLEGVKSVRRTIENAARLHVEVLTLYAFSVENWKRPEKEVNALMRLLSEFLQKEVKVLVENNIRFNPIGRWQQLPQQAASDLQDTIDATSHCDGMLLQVALNYGGRTEIVDAVKAIAAEVESGQLSQQDIDEETIASSLYTAGVADPDLLIRTSGEFRISNYLLWQIAYTEMHITDTLWPDFRLLHLLQAIADFQGRDRRFGGLKGSN